MKRLLLSKKTSKILSLALAIALLALYVPATITASAMSGSGTIGNSGEGLTFRATDCEVQINIQSVEYTEFTTMPIKYAVYVLEAQIEPAEMANMAGIQVDWQPSSNVVGNPDNQWQAGSVVMIPTTITVIVTIGDEVFTDSLLLLPE